MQRSVMHLNLQASVGFQPGKQVIQHGATSVANTGGPSVKKKSGMRRSSILKVTSTAPMSATSVSAQQDKRGPLKVHYYMLSD